MSALRGKADMIICRAICLLLRSLSEESGHDILRRVCLLLAQSGHGTLGGANLNRNVAHPELGGGNETARVHNTIGWFSGHMAAYVACPAGGDASDRISQQWIA
jgi:hypothetical protein